MLHQRECGQKGGESRSKLRQYVFYYNEVEADNKTFSSLPFANFGDEFTETVMPSN